MKRAKIGMALGMLCAFLAVGTSCSKKGSAKSNFKPVQIGYERGTLCAAPIHVAMENGLLDEEFKKIGQSYTLVDMTSGASQAELIASGKLDAAYNLSLTLMQPIDNGLPIAFVTGVHTGCTKYYAKPGSGITSPADLRGKKVGVISLADSSVMNLLRKLDDLGFIVQGPDAEVELLVYSGEDLPIALDKGAVDAIALHDPTAAIAEQEYGLTKILDIATDPKLEKEYCCQAFVTRKLFTENPEAAAAFARAMQKASAFIKAEPRAAAQLQIEKKLVSGELDFNTALLASYDFTPSVSLGRKGFADAAVQLQKFGTIKATTDLEQFTRNSYPVLAGVPESYVYDSASKTYREVTENVTR